MESINQYLQTLIQERGYLLKSKKEKSKLLDEYCKNTGLKRKYVIWKLRNGKYIKDKSRTIKRKRKAYYDNNVKIALIRCWEIFDYPCGQRLEPLLKDETDRLRSQEELECSDEVVEKLKKISARTIDEKLKKHKEKERLKRKYHQKNNPLLYQKIPVKLFDEWDRNQLGNIQMDLVEHCGQSARNYWTKLEPFSSNNFCPDGQKSRPAFPPPPKAEAKQKNFLNIFFNRPLVNFFFN